jgi:hypothetical protein
VNCNTLTASNGLKESGRMTQDRESSQFAFGQFNS